MSYFNRTGAMNNAVSVVTAALEAGAIRLLGPTGYDGPEVNAASDAQYLNKLLNSIAENLNVEK